MNLLSIYESRYGTAIRRQGDGFNGPCPLCGGDLGKSDRFVVWPHKRDGIGEACQKHGLDGVWWCRRCDSSGDSIAYLMQCEGMSFKDALREFGINPDGGKSTSIRPRHSSPAQPVDTGFCPKTAAGPCDKWRTYAEKLVTEGEQHIFSQPQALAWLAARGIDADAVRKYRIGYLPPEGKCTFGRFRSRNALGLEDVLKADGTPKKLLIPRGIVIPTLDITGTVTNIRIRRHAEDLTPMPDGRTPPKYMELSGSSHAPLLLRPDSAAALSVYVIVEAELDAMLVHHATHGRVGALATRTSRGKPDMLAHQQLKDCARILVALDYDEAGAAGVDWWLETYPQAKRWPTPDGKDPGDAFALGEDIREWIAAGLPPSMSLADGQVDACASGENVGGSGASPESACKNMKKEEDRTNPTKDIDGSTRQFRHWAQATASTPVADAVLPPDAPSLSELRRALAGKEVSDKMLVACPKHQWWWTYYGPSKRGKFGCKNCSGHPKCIVDFQLSEQMRAPH